MLLNGELAGQPTFLTSECREQGHRDSAIEFTIGCNSAVPVFELDVDTIGASGNCVHIDEHRGQQRLFVC